MSRRSESFDEYVSKSLRNIKMARAYVLAGQEEGESMEQAVVDLIRSYGIKEFIQDYKLSRPMVYRLLRQGGRHYDAIEKIFKRLKLKIHAFDPSKASKELKKAA